MNPIAFAAAFGAGVLSVISPCVLPILPIVFGAASSKSRFGPPALAAGVALSFTVVGLFLATIGFSLGFDETIFHRLAGTLLLGLGLVLISARLQAAAETALGPISTWAAAKTSNVVVSGPMGLAGLGFLLGAVWSPCVGPTLGAASLLASQGRDLPSVLLTMTLFGLGAAAPLLAIGSMSRGTLQRWRGRLTGAGRWGKLLLGVSMLVAGALALTGFDKTLEAFLVALSPAWLSRLTSLL